MPRQSPELLARLALANDEYVKRKAEARSRCQPSLVNLDDIAREFRVTKSQLKKFRNPAPKEPRRQRKRTPQQRIVQKLRRMSENWPADLHLFHNGTKLCVMRGEECLAFIAIPTLTRD